MRSSVRRSRSSISRPISGAPPMSRDRCGGRRAATCYFAAPTSSAGNMRPGRRSRSSRRIPTPRMGSHAIYRAGWWPAKPLREESFERNTMAQGRPLNYPNDVVVKSDGAIYFTDPWTGPRAQEPPGDVDLNFAGVYRISPDRGTLTLLVNDFLTPNGIAFSPDESVLYINDTQRRHIRAFELQPNGTLARQTDRVFADLSGPEPGVPDGMKVDSAGNVYCGGAGGLYILDPTGKKLGRIVHGFENTANVAFGGDDWKTVYFCTRTSLGMFKVKIAGVPVPVVKKS